MTIEYARNVLGLAEANSTEMDPATPHPVIELMDSQRGVTDKGGTMRLGAYIAQLQPGSQVAELYGTTVVSERHRHRNEFNPRYRSRFDDGDFCCSGMSPDGRLVEFIELRSHPFWVGTQAHPEFKSRPERPAPLFLGLVRAALARAEGRAECAAATGATSRRRGRGRGALRSRAQRVRPHGGTDRPVPDGVTVGELARR